MEGGWADSPQYKNILSVTQDMCACTRTEIMDGVAIILTLTFASVSLSLPTQNIKTV